VEAPVLKQSNLRFDIPVSDLSRAKKFYADQLGLVCNYENDYSAQYRYSSSYFVLTPSESAGRARHSILTWLVEDITSVKRWLEDRGVAFEEYDLGYTKTIEGIAQLGDDRVTWFRDSEGNLLAIAQLG
jgi:predicted enzyme related to lactoylglutathione lyase